MPTQKISQARNGSVENSINVIVPRRPWVLQKQTCALFVLGNNIIPKPIKRLTQRAAPLLVPAGTPACVTAAIALPTANTVRAAPGSLFLNSNFLRRWVQCEVLAIIRQAGEFV